MVHRLSPTPLRSKPEESALMLVMKKHVADPEPSLDPAEMESVLFTVTSRTYRLFGVSDTMVRKQGPVLFF